MIFHDGFATRIEVYDATCRSVDLCHFAGRTTLSVVLPDNHRYREIRADRRTARELAALFDHFARHEQLPHRHAPPDDYQI